MKRVFYIIGIVIVILLMLTSCYTNTTANTQERFVVEHVNNAGYGYSVYILYDTQNNRQYLVVNDYNESSVTPLLQKEDK